MTQHLFKKPLCGCTPSCKAWARLRAAEDHEERLARMWVKAQTERREARDAYVNHLDTITEEAAA
jgi:hypothetical protein